MATVHCLPLHRFFFVASLCLALTLDSRRPNHPADHRETSLSKARFNLEAWRGLGRVGGRQSTGSPLIIIMFSIASAPFSRLSLYHSNPTTTARRCKSSSRP
jgi:hypothetical protein